VGENGAGKSTLVKVVAGLVRPQGGRVLIDGEPVELRDRRTAAAHGIGVVHQHFSLIPTMTVAENLQLGRPGAGRLLARDDARRDVREWSGRLGLAVDPDAVVERLSIGEQQRVEILSALAWGARVLLLDEPTAVLSPDEADQVLGVVRALAADGLAVLLVTHKLREVAAVADCVTVLRAGRVTGRHTGGGTPVEVLAAEVMGAGETSPLRREPADMGAVRLRATGVTTPTTSGVDLAVRSGEVCGIAGVAGNGQRDLVAVLAGLQAPLAGTVVVDDIRIDGDAGAALRAGVAYVPEDRAADGLAMSMPVWANAVAKTSRKVSSWRGLDRDAIATAAERIIGHLSVRPHRPELAAGALSGGNQQRLVLGRELDGAPGVIVAAEPTRGLDPASARGVIEALRTAAARGAAVVVVASDLDELLDVADTVVVLFEGRVVGRWSEGAIDRAAIGHAMVAS
jgi:ABC-type uncharacterized transport system ATPase subunit